MQENKKVIYADDLLSSLRDDETIDGAHFKRVKQHINAAPAVDTVVHGRWVGSGQWNHKPYRMKNKEKWQTFLCSECGHSNGRRFNDNYCPNCGAKMDGGNEDG